MGKEVEVEEVMEGYKETEIGVLPEDWEVVRLGEVAHVTAGGSAPQGDHFFGGKNPFIRVQHIDEVIGRVSGWNLITDEAVSKYSLRLFPKGTIVFPKSGASIRLEKRAILPVDAYIVSHLCAVLPDVQMVHDIFLFHTLRSVRFAESKAEGYPTISLSEIKATLIPLPPLHEQRKIAHVLSATQRAIEATERVIATTRELKKSLMHYLFTYGPVPVDQIDRVLLKDTEIGPVPEHWEVVRLGEVFEFSRKPRSLDINKCNQIPFITMEYIPDEEVYLSKYDLKVSDEIKSGTFFFNGDLLIAKITPSFENGKQCIVKNLPTDFGYATTEVWPIHGTDEAKILCLFYYLKKHDIRAEIASKMEGSTGRQRVPKNVLENLMIPNPPLSEQREIARILQSVDRKIESEEKRKETLKALFKTMLHLLMTGKLRVKNLEVAFR